LAEERAERRLAAILAADVVGYSRLMEADETGTFARLRAHRKELFEPAVARHQGRIFKLMGDGLLAEFPSVVGATECAIAVQRGMAERNHGIPPDQRIDIRIGINLGDVIVEGDDRHGDDVNIAARLEAMADPGGICISGSVYDQPKGEVNAAFEDIGPRGLKNIAQPVHVYRINADAAAGLAGELRRPEALPLPAKPSVAVLAFDDLSGDPAQQYYSDGITEDIITELSRFRSLFVIARNSSFAYRGTAVDLRRVGRELGVRFVVEGSFRRAGSRLRIAVQLIEAGTGNHLWAERYDRDIGDLFDVQDEVARTIVATLAGRLEEAELKGAARRRTDSLPAYDCLLRGIEHLRGYAADDNTRARELFERAIALDPRFALAYAYLALALLVEHGYDDAPEPVRDRALEAAQMALRLDPGDGRCHQFLAQAYLYKRAFDQATAHSERSIALNPNDANGLAQRGLVLAYVGRAEQGIEAIREAMRLNPLHPEWYWAALAVPLYAARRYEDALEADRRIAGAKRPWHVARLAACYAGLGRLAEARATAAEVLRQDPDFHLSTISLRYRNADDAAQVLDGMRKAGLPE
jgi:adenylate cyclase